MIWKTISFLVYNFWTLLFTKTYYVDDDLDASDNVISGHEPSSEMLTSQRSFEINLINRIKQKIGVAARYPCI